jgi:hypothetical protein
MNYAPIVLFVYNRPSHAKQTLEALAQNKIASESVLYIFCDGPKKNASQEVIENIKLTREVVRLKMWCRDVNIIESPLNKGLAKSIVEGVTETIAKYGKVIVLEDDVVPSTGFLDYMNNALNLYQADEKVMHISGFLPYTTGEKKLPTTFFLRYMSCWGWATWKRAWDQIVLDEVWLYENVKLRKDFAAFDLEGSVQVFDQLEQNVKGVLHTWAVKWYSTIFIKNGLCLYPKKSLVSQIGFDGSGTHCTLDNSSVYQVGVADKILINRIESIESKVGKKHLKRFYKYGPDSSIIKRLKLAKNKAILPFIRVLKGY